MVVALSAAAFKAEHPLAGRQAEQPTQRVHAPRLRVRLCGGECRDGGVGACDAALHQVPPKDVLRHSEEREVLPRRARQPDQHVMRLLRCLDGQRAVRNSSPASADARHHLRRRRPRLRLAPVRERRLAPVRREQHPVDDAHLVARKRDEQLRL
eukprot:269254-Pleurochrysis_carterae.AAC.1